MINNQLLKIKQNNSLLLTGSEGEGKGASGTLCARLSGEAAQGLSYGETGVHFAVIWKTFKRNSGIICHLCILKVCARKQTYLLLCIIVKNKKK